MPRVGIALGSNLGDRLAHLHAAREACGKSPRPASPSCKPPIYQTEPLLCPPGSPYFLQLRGRNRL